MPSMAKFQSFQPENFDPPVSARIANIFDRRRVEADPGEQALHETATLGKRAQRIDHLPVDEAEIADVARDRSVGGH